VKTSLDLVFLGLSMTSSWGNGHATTYRALLAALAHRGHQILFLERDAPWYAAHRDLPSATYAQVRTYRSLDELRDVYAAHVRQADVVVVGSYVPEGSDVGAWVTSTARGKTAFYDIDTPITLRALEEGSCVYLGADLVGRYDLYLSFTGGPTLARLESRFGARAARALYCSVDAAVHTPQAAPVSWDLAYLGTHSADRQPLLDRLMLEPARAWSAGRFAVAGAQYPSHIQWPRNVKRIEHVSPLHHNAFYAGQRFALNVTRADMAAAGWSPSVRLFEAAACGTPIITDYWAGLEEFFEPGREILVTHSPEDSLRWLRELGEDERLAVAGRARARALAEHTSASRAEDFERYVDEIHGRGVARRGTGRDGAALEGQ
jgi:spore maturation protein CgeB